MLHGMLVRRVNDLLMTQMHAIKYADGECERTWDSGEFFDAVQYLHPKALPRARSHANTGSDDDLEMACGLASRYGALHGNESATEGA